MKKNYSVFHHLFLSTVLMIVTFTLIAATASNASNFESGATVNKTTQGIESMWLTDLAPGSRIKFPIDVIVRSTLLGGRAYLPATHISSEPQYDVVCFLQPDEHYFKSELKMPDIFAMSGTVEFVVGHVEKVNTGLGTVALINSNGDGFKYNGKKTGLSALSCGRGTSGHGIETINLSMLTVGDFRTLIDNVGGVVELKPLPDFMEPN